LTISPETPPSGIPPLGAEPNPRPLSLQFSDR
jgi:hypothetical protein